MDGLTLRNVATKVSQYFRDFLDSDFKRQQAPRRRIILQSDSGFRAGMRTSPFPSLDRDLWALLGRASSEEPKLSISPRKYMRPISAVLRKVIEEQVNAIPESAVETVRLAVRDKATTTYTRAVDNVEAWVESIQIELADQIGAQIIRPLLAHLDGPLRTQAYWASDSLYAAESDLIALVGSDFAAVLPEVLAKLLARQDAEPLESAVEEFLTLDGVRLALLSFFESFAAADAYLDFRDLETYVATSDGLQLYLYVGSLKYRGNNYPLFYLPVEVERTKDGAGYTLKVINGFYPVSTDCWVKSLKA